VIGLRAERLAVDCDQAGNVALAGFDDVFGGVVTIIDFAEKVAQGTVSLLGVLAILNGSADERGGVGGLGWIRLGGRRHCQRQQ
jgi:hypothetical protein